MRLFIPFEKAILTQKFGKENTSQNPVIQKWYKDLDLLGHNGWDWGGQVVHICAGKPIYWDCDIEGEVTDIFTSQTQGAGVYITTKDEDGEFRHCFWHMQPNIQCGLGKIMPGELLGYVDNSGQYTTGSHLHRGLYKLPRESDNGYNGAVDIEPYFNPIFILVYLNLNQQVSILKKVVELFKQLLGIKGR